MCSKAQGDRTLNATKEGRVRRRCYVDSYHKADYSWVRLAARKLGLLVRRLLRRGSRAFSTTGFICEARGRAPPSRSWRRGGELFEMAQSWGFSACGALYSLTKITIHNIAASRCRVFAPAEVLPLSSAAVSRIPRRTRDAARATSRCSTRSTRLVPAQIRLPATVPARGARSRSAAGL